MNQNVTNDYVDRNLWQDGETDGQMGEQCKNITLHPKQNIQEHAVFRSMIILRNAYYTKQYKNICKANFYQAKQNITHCHHLMELVVWRVRVKVGELVALL